MVDNEQDICLVLKIVLEKAGFSVKDYYNPILALNEFKSNFYDLIILDIQMPGMNGLQLCRDIREKDPKVKVCFLTASEFYYEEYRKEYPSQLVNYLIKSSLFKNQSKMKI